MIEHYILDGKEPVKVSDIMTWATWLDTADERVKQTTLSQDVRVSTVFLGLDHQWGDGPPLLFETMVFGGEHDQEQWRYSTWDEAVAGHEAAVARLTSRRCQHCGGLIVPECICCPGCGSRDKGAIDGNNTGNAR